jgi:hypothetical protein
MGSGIHGGRDHHDIAEVQSPEIVLLAVPLVSCKRVFGEPPRWCRHIPRLRRCPRIQAPVRPVPFTAMDIGRNTVSIIAPVRM